jgi:hypothetical protein
VELHDTGLASVALRAALRGLRVLYLGPNLPLAEYARVVLDRRPGFALLSVSRAVTLAFARSELLRFLRRVPGSTRVLLGGAGIRPGDVAWIERAGGRVLTSGGFTRLLEDLE